MKIKGLHPEHRHRRLIEEITKTIMFNILIRNTIIGIFFSILVSFVLFLYFTLLPGFTNFDIDMISLVIPISIVFLFIFIVIVSIIFIAAVHKNYSSTLINIWLEKLFKNYWILHFTDFDKFGQSSKEESKANILLGLFNVSPMKFNSNTIGSFLPFFKYARLFYDLTPRLYALHPSNNYNSLEIWISEKKSVALIKILLIRLVFFGIFILSISTFSSYLFYLLIFLVLVTYIAILPKSIAKACNATVLRAILCALYLRDPDHEITDQRVLGIPAYIDYKSLVQQVDSYMID